MEFKVNVEGIDYNIETSKREKSSYYVKHEDHQYEISLGGSNEWFCLNYKHGAYPIPVNYIREAIQDHFGPKA